MSLSRFIEKVDLPAAELPDRWYNVVPDLPRLPDPYLDPATGQPPSLADQDRAAPPSIMAQEFSFERWIGIPQPVLDAYRLWRPTPLMRAHALERELGTPAEIWFKYEGASPSGSHKLNSALAQAYFAKNDGVKRLVTDTGAGQWGSALALAGALAGIEVVVYMVRASYQQKPYRRYLMETYGARVLPSPGDGTAYGRRLLAEHPDHPGSEATAVSEVIEAVLADEGARGAVGAFANHVLLHQTIVGLELQEQLRLVDRTPDYLVAPVGCGSNMGGFCLPFVPAKLAGAEITMLAAEPAACPTLTRGEYRYDFGDAEGAGILARTYTLGHEFVPAPIHAGGLRYHGAAPLIGQLRHEGLLDAVAYDQPEVFEAATLFARLHGLLPAPETAHAIRAVIDVANDCRERGRRATIVFCYSGHGLLDLEAYGRFNAGQIESSADEPFVLAGTEPVAG
ncbi:MAG TPA: TrpB-like pyridoxal phosphate-dependent enzyme [Conexibacter sp.]|nr:TrpB-like pyridoxal phosphate-dependent enzyme [Conexibacter sp.]